MSHWTPTFWDSQSSATSQDPHIVQVDEAISIFWISQKY